jgi:hypothetical protein
MATLEQIAERLKELIKVDARDKILAKGLARGFIWKGGSLPEGSPAYGRHLTGNLLDYGYSILLKAIHLYEASHELEIAKDSLRYAAECIESAVRKGDPNDFRGFHLLISACAFHLAGYAARSFCLLEEQKEDLNLSSIEKILFSLLRKELKTLKLDCYEWLNNRENTDSGYAKIITDSVSNEDLQIELEDVLVKALSFQYMQAIALFEYALSTGKDEYIQQAKEKIISGTEISMEASHVPQWWIHKLSFLLIGDIWDNSLHQLLPMLSETSEEGEASETDDILEMLLRDSIPSDQWNSLRRKFIAIQGARNISEISLWPSQIEAARRAFDQEDDLVIALPTSAGKTKIAELCILRTLALGKRAVYVTPLRALSAQIEKRLARSFIPLGFSVSSLYGSSGVTFEDISTLKEDAIVIATPEKLDFAMRQDPNLLDDIGVIVLDEGHMIGLGTREIRYEVLVQRLLKRHDAKYRRIVCLSAIFSSGDSFDDCTAWLRSDSAGSPVHSAWRPTRQRLALLPFKAGEVGRLTFERSHDFDETFIPSFMNPSQATVGTRRNSCPNDQQELTLKTTEKLVQAGHKVLAYCPQKRSVESLAEKAIKLKSQGLFSSLISDFSKIERALAIGAEWLGTEHIALKCLRLGIGIHHGSLPRPFLSEIEQLLDKKHLPMVIASPTLAQGVDLTCSALVFHSIYQFGNELIKGSDYANVIGRVGRAFVDLDGLIVFPIFGKFDEGRMINYKKNETKKLMTSISERSLESGIVELIETIIQKIKNKITLSDGSFENYVLNQSFDWNLYTNPSPKETDDQNTQEESYFLDSFDCFILATVENLDCDVSELASILDQALQSSLWMRRLNRLPEAKAIEQKSVLLGRAQWLWNHSTVQQRKGFFTGGIGYKAGQLIENNLDNLVRLLFEADSAITEAKVDEFCQDIESIASIIFDTYPYSREGRSDEWKRVLKLWLSGASLESLNGDTRLLSCIQEDFVFRLVWGVEAIRAYAKEVGRNELDNLSGTIPLAITYGVPSRSASLLIQCGLPSRAMSQNLATNVLPSSISKKSELLAYVQNMSTVFEDGSQELFIWNEFLLNFQKSNSISQQEKTYRFKGITASQGVNFISKGIQTILTTPELSPIGNYKIDSRNLVFLDSETVNQQLLIKTISV